MRKLLLAAVLVVLLLSTVSTAAAAPSHAQVFFAGLSSDQEVPPRDSPATAFAVFHRPDHGHDGAVLHYALGVAHIENVIAAHIHLGSPGENGPIVAFLYGPAAPGGGDFHALFVSGTVTDAELVGPLEGQSLSDLIAHMEAGNAYVNVHTDDGVAPANTGAGDFPGGEVRGQISAVGFP